jgi:glutathione S-transferase
VRFNASKLYPVDPLARSMVERWMDWQLSVLNPPMVTMLLGYYRTAEEKRDKAALENARQQAIQQWSIVEGQLKDRSFLTGDAFTLADIGNGILAHRWHSYPIERPNFPNLKRWYERLQDRPGFKSHIAGPIS